MSDVANERVVATYDRFSGAYDLWITPLSRSSLRLALEYLDVDPGDRFLDVGCGPGHAVAALSPLVEQSGLAIGLDAATGMVDRSRHRTEHVPQAANLQGDARQLPIGDGCVDLVLLEDTLELFTPQEIQIVLEECSRVLAEEGELCVITMEREGHEFDPFVRLYEWCFEHVPGFANVGCRPIYARKALERAGFEIRRQLCHRRGYLWPTTIYIGELPSNW